jgi:hypothetical protein
MANTKKHNDGTILISGWFINGDRQFVQIGRTSKKQGMICLKIPQSIWGPMCKWFAGFLLSGESRESAQFGENIKCRVPSYAKKQWVITAENRYLLKDNPKPLLLSGVWVGFYSDDEHPSYAYIPLAVFKKLHVLHKKGD